MKVQEIKELRDEVKDMAIKIAIIQQELLTIKNNHLFHVEKSMNKLEKMCFWFFGIVICQMLYFIWETIG